MRDPRAASHSATLTVVSETVAGRTREVVRKNTIESARRSRLDDCGSTPREDVAHETRSLSREPSSCTEGIACQDPANAVHLALVARHPDVARLHASSESRPSISAAPPPPRPECTQVDRRGDRRNHIGMHHPEWGGSARAPRRRAVGANAVFPSDSTRATWRDN